MATPARMIAPATMVRAVSGSEAKAAPSRTATTGFTYAYVDTSDVRALRISHAYAEKPTSDPATTSQPTASRD